MVYSSSYIFAKEEFGSSLYFAKKQLGYMVLGSFLCFVISLTKIQFWIKYSLPIAAFFCLLIVLTQIPALSIMQKGSKRWLVLFGRQFQPGEFIKIGLLLCATHFFEFYKMYSRKQIILRLSVIILPLLIMVLQPDFGMLALSTVFIFYICFLSKFPRKYLYGSFVISFASLGMLLVSAPYRVKRLLVFLDPWADPRNAGFQIIQSYLAFAHGQITGLGLGNSKEKLFYLPEAHNDFIFSVIGEELGFIGVFIVLSLFLCFLFTGMTAAMKKEGLTQKIALSIVFMIGFQAFTNIGVVIGILPTKGLNLPFISYGGSSLISNFILLGIYFSCIRNQKIELLTFKEKTVAKPKNYRNKLYESHR
jgi:cell division protein FtsW